MSHFFVSIKRNCNLPRTFLNIIKGSVDNTGWIHQRTKEEGAWRFSTIYKRPGRLCLKENKKKSLKWVLKKQCFYEQEHQSAFHQSIMYCFLQLSNANFTENSEDNYLPSNCIREREKKYHLHTVRKSWRINIKSDHEFCGKINIFTVKSTLLLKKLLKSWFHENFLSMIAFSCTLQSSHCSGYFYKKSRS